MNEAMGPQPGQFVKVLRGRDKGTIAIVVGIINERLVSIADGDKRKFDQPKKKNLIHLQLLKDRSSEVMNSLNQNGRVTNGKLRYAVNSYLEAKLTEAHEKGE